MSSLIPGETLRILLISIDEQARDEIGQILTGRVGDYRLFWVSQTDLALTRVQDVIPHLVLIDDSLGSTAMNALIAQVSARMPATAILALIAPQAVEVASQAMLAGARAFIVKPINADQLTGMLRQVLAPRQTASRGGDGTQLASGRIVAFCAPKGGTGRTTLAINTAVSLKMKTGAPVVLVDADFAAPALDVALNLQHERTIVDLLPRLTRLDEELVASVLAEHAAGISVLLAPPPADLKAPITLPQAQQVMSWLKRMYPWVIVDLGLPMDETAFAFLDGADRIVMSVLPEMVGLRNTRLMLDQLAGRGYPLEKTWLVLNRSGMAGGVPAGDIEDRLKVALKHRIPDDQPLATHSINRGVPLVSSHPRSAVARAFAQLADSLKRETPSAADQGAPSTDKAPHRLSRILGNGKPNEPARETKPAGV